MGAKDKPLIERADLIAAIEQHFVKELKVDQNDEIGKFLTLKREETHQHIRQGRNNNRATRQDRANRMKPPAAIPSGGSVGSGGT